MTYDDGIGIVTGYKRRLCECQECGQKYHDMRKEYRARQENDDEEASRDDRPNAQPNGGEAA